MKLSILCILVFMANPFVSYAADDVADDELVSEKVAREVSQDLSQELTDFIDEVDPPDNDSVAELKDNLPVEIPNKVDTMDELVNQPDENKISQQEIQSLRPDAPKKKAIRLVKIKSGFHRTIKQCRVHLDPKLSATERGSVKKGLKIWADVVDKNWVKVYQKKGPGYISADCLKASQKSAISSL